MFEVKKELMIDIDKSNGIYLKKYDTFSPFILGYSKVTKDNIVNYIDIYGNDVILSEEKIDKINNNNDDTLELQVDMKNKKFGYIDSDNNVVIDYKYDFAREFSGGLAYVKNGNTKAYIDKEENIILISLYKYSGNFKDGLTVVKNDKWGIIDKTGREVFPCIASEIMLLGYNRVYIDGYMYDLSKIKFRYILNFKINDNIIKREFTSRSEMEKYENILCETIINVVKKYDSNKIKKLTV